MFRIHDTTALSTASSPDTVNYFSRVSLSTNTSGVSTTDPVLMVSRPASESLNYPLDICLLERDVFETEPGLNTRHESPAIPSNDYSIEAYRASDVYASAIEKSGNSDDPNDIVPDMLVKMCSKEGGILEGRTLVIHRNNGTTLYTAQTQPGGKVISDGKLLRLDAVHIKLGEREKGDSMYRKMIAAANKTNVIDISDETVTDLKKKVADFVRRNPDHAEAANRALENDPLDLLSTDEAINEYNRTPHPEHPVFTPRPSCPWMAPLTCLIELAAGSLSNLLITPQPSFGNNGLFSQVNRGVQKIWNTMLQDPLVFPSAEATVFYDRWRCMDNSHYISASKVCDNIEDCPDASDESSACCSGLYPVCFIYGREFNIGSSSYCTGLSTCDGGVDQLLAYCKHRDVIDDLLICNNNVTIDYHLACEGINVCGDATYDQIPYCQEKVDSGKLAICEGSNQVYDPVTACNGQNQCLNGWDEQNCSDDALENNRVQEWISGATRPAHKPAFKIRTSEGYQCLGRFDMSPNTVAPTTVAPTTVAPTTVAPTTVAPTTVAPTTVAPTTVAPTTVAPTTVAPTAHCQDGFEARAQQPTWPCGWYKGSVAYQYYHKTAMIQIQLDAIMFPASSQLKEDLCRPDLVKPAARFLLHCGQDNNQPCELIKARSLNVLSRNLGIQTGAVLISVKNSKLPVPPSSTDTQSHLILSSVFDQRHDGITNNPTVHVELDNDIESVQLTLYQQGTEHTPPSSSRAALSTGTIHRHKIVFRGGSEDYQPYDTYPDGYRQIRAPSVIAQGNVVMVFAEGRRDTRDDPGHKTSPIDIVYKKSINGGISFGDLQVLANGEDSHRGSNSKVAYQPTSLMDTHDCHQRMYVFYNRAQHRSFYRYSDNFGQNWSEEHDFSREIQGLPDNRRKLTVSLASGIQMEDGKLVVPMNIAFRDDSITFHASVRPAVVFSDDHGETWHYGGHAPIGANEHQIVEVFTSRGHSRLLSSSRRDGNGRRGINTRRMNYGRFSQAENRWHWGDNSSPKYPNLNPIYAFPISAGFERYTRRGVNGERTNRLLLTLPQNKYTTGRRRAGTSDFCLYVSTNEGSSYGRSRLLHNGPRVGYSDIANVDGDKFLVAWERGISREPGDTVMLTTANRNFIYDRNKPSC